MVPTVILEDLGLMDYQQAWDYQERLFKQIIDQKIAQRNQETSEKTQDYLLFCEHPHVYTLGKSGDKGNLLLNEEQLSDVGASFYAINRGGDITYHGPGQLVAYPIFNLDHFFTDIHKYLRFLEEAVIQTNAFFGVESTRYEGLTGVWVGAETNHPRKICAIGVRASRWVTMHGIGYNVNSNLDYFKHIVPCGIDDKAVTSLAAELGGKLDMEEVKQELKKNLAQIFGFRYL